MTQKQLVAIAASGSALLLAGAFLFQFLGYAPCKMCIWQRYPHGVAAVGGLAFWLAPLGIIALLGALAALTTSGVGVFHAGVEQGWWEGPSTCTSGDISGVSAEDLLNQILNAPLVRCDEIAWSFADISMAGWNAILSFILALVWIAAWKKSADSSAS